MTFTRRWSKELQAAILDRILESGWSAPQALEAARAGALQWKGKTLPPADPPLSTVRDWARVARRDREEAAAAAAGPEAFLTRHLGELVGLLDTDRAKIRQKMRGGKAGSAEIAAAAKAGVEVARLAKAVREPNPSKAPVQTGAAAAQSDTPFVDALAGEDDDTG